MHSGIAVQVSPLSRLEDSVTGCGSRCTHSIRIGVPATNCSPKKGVRLLIAGNALVSLLTCSSVADASTLRAPLVMAKPIRPVPARIADAPPHPVDHRVELRVAAAPDQFNRDRQRRGRVGVRLKSRAVVVDPSQIGDVGGADGEKFVDGSGLERVAQHQPDLRPGGAVDLGNRAAQVHRVAANDLCEEVVERVG